MMEALVATIPRFPPSRGAMVHACTHCTPHPHFEPSWAAAAGEDPDGPHTLVAPRIPPHRLKYAERGGEG